MIKEVKEMLLTLALFSIWVGAIGLLAAIACPLIAPLIIAVTLL